MEGVIIWCTACKSVSHRCLLLDNTEGQNKKKTGILPWSKCSSVTVAAFVPPLLTSFSRSSSSRDTLRCLWLWACHMLMYSSTHSHRRSSTALKYSPISLSSANGSQPVTTLAFSDSSNVIRSNVPHNCTSAQCDHEIKSTSYLLFQTGETNWPSDPVGAVCSQGLILFVASWVFPNVLPHKDGTRTNTKREDWRRLGF